MISYLNLPAKIIGLLEANISPKEIALGVCLGLFLGFTPLNGTMALALALVFLLVKVNRMSTVLTLPVFKAIYLLGGSSLAQAVGSAALLKMDVLEGMWRLITHAPVLALLDINRTTVAGGLIVAGALSVPLFFIVQAGAKPILAKYTELMGKTAFSRWVRGAYHVSNVLGTDADSTITNVESTLKTTVIGKIRSAIIKPKTPKTQTGIMKRINIRGVAIIIGALLLIQVGIGLIISPAVGALVVAALNKTGTAKVTLEKLNVWPLTLSFSMKELKVFDPKESDKRVIRVAAASVHVSPLALLSKRLVFSTVTLKGAELDLEGAPYGSFNIQRLAAPKSAVQAQDMSGIFKEAREKRDWFGKIYSMIKNKFSKEGRAQAKKTAAVSKKVTRDVQTLPKGKLVTFKTPADLYLLEIRDLNIDGKVNVLPANARPVELRNAKINVLKLAIDPDNGVKFSGMKMRGELFRDNASAGRLDIDYADGERNVSFNAALENVDLKALQFIYADSLPVSISKGKISLNTDTRITDGAIESRNSITLSGHDLEQKPGGVVAMGFLPTATICEALNKIDPLDLKFDITGTVDNPEFKGFEDTLMTVIKPYVANIGDNLKSQGIKSLGKFFKSTAASETQTTGAADTQSPDKTAQEAVDTLKSLFGTKKQ